MNLNQLNDTPEDEFLPNGIPKRPAIYYRESGWQGWADFLGTEALVATADDLPSVFRALLAITEGRNDLADEDRMLREAISLAATAIEVSKIGIDLLKIGPIDINRAVLEGMVPILSGNDDNWWELALVRQALAQLPRRDAL